MEKTLEPVLDLVPQLEAERRALAAVADRLRTALAGIGIATGASSTQIVPAIVGGAADAMALAAALEDAGVLAPAIRPPTVPAGSSRIRFALSAAVPDRAHGMDHVARRQIEPRRDARIARGTAADRTRCTR